MAVFLGNSSLEFCVEFFRFLLLCVVFLFRLLVRGLRLLFKLLIVALLLLL